MKATSALLSAIVSAFALSTLPAYAAEEKPAETPAASTEPAKPVAKKKVKPHTHALEKSGTPSTKPEAAPAEPQQPIHDHGKVHK